MKMAKHTLGRLCPLGILISMIIFSSCGSDSTSQGNEPSGKTSALTFQIELAQPPSRESNVTVERAIGEPDVCADYMIDTFSVHVHRTQDDTLVASAEASCAEHNLIVENIPVDENLYVVCDGIVGGTTLWKRQVSDIVVLAGETKEIGPIVLDYIGDDVSSPEVVSTYPLEGATGVDLKATIAVVFNEALAPGSITDKALTVSNNDISIPGKVSYDSNTYMIQFMPTDESGFEIETVYTANLQSQADGDKPITDMAGQPIAGGLGWRFTTGGAQDTVAPQVILTSPADGAVDVGQPSSISVVFSEPMDPASLSDRVIQVSSVHGTVSGQIVYDDPTRTLTLKPDTDLHAGTLYTAVITTGARDLVQNRILEPYRWGFSTIASGGYYTVSTSTIPANGSGGTISPANATVQYGDDQAFDIQPRLYHYLSELIVDGNPVEPVSTYIFENVAENHRIQAVFKNIKLIGHWPFDNNAMDSVGDNNGILNGGGYVAGAFEQAVEFDGVDDYVDIAPSPSFSLSSFTLSAWVKIPGSIQPSWRVIIEHDRFGSNWFGLYKSSGVDRFHFRWANSGIHKADFNTTIYPNTWYHVVGTFGNGTAKMYLNGVLDKVVTGAQAGVPNDAGLRIGRNQSDLEAFNAIIDDVRIFNSALSEQDVLDLYGSP